VGVRGLDLRGIAGGSLAASIRLADLFLSDGTIVSLRGKGVPEQSNSATPQGDLPADLPIVVLIDEGSASASEVLTGALKDNGRAMVLGERTFGKGLVQQVISLPSGTGQLKITEANYYLPSGRNIQRKDDSPVWGVDPSPGFYVPLTPEQSFEVWSIRRQQEILRPNEDEDPSLWEDADRIRAELKDPQLAAAVDALVAKLTTGEFVAPNPGAAPAEMQAGLLSAERDRLRALERELLRTRNRIVALQEGAGEGAEADLFPGDDAIVGGTVELRDVDGNVLQELRVTGGGLDRWLRDAPLEPVEDDE